MLVHFIQKKSDTIECFDQADKSMSFEKFEEATGISKEDIQNWYNSNKSKIENSRDLNKVSEEVQLDVVTKDIYINPSQPYFLHIYLILYWTSTEMIMYNIRGKRSW